MPAGSDGDIGVGGVSHGVGDPTSQGRFGRADGRWGLDHGADLVDAIVGVGTLLARIDCAAPTVRRKVEPHLLLGGTAALEYSPAVHVDVNRPIEIEQLGIGPQDELLRIMYLHVDCPVRFDHGVYLGEVADFVDGRDLGPVCPPVDRQIGAECYSRRMLHSPLLERPVEDSTGRYLHGVVFGTGYHPEPTVVAQFPQTPGHRNGAVLCVDGPILLALHKEHGDVSQVLNQGEMPVGRRQGNAGCKQVGITAAKVRGAGAPHRLAAADDPVAIYKESAADFLDDGEYVIFADATILGRAPAVRADDNNTPHFGFSLVDSVAVGGMIEVLVLVAARAVQGDQERQSPRAVIRRRQIEAVGLIGVVDRGSVRERQIARPGARVTAEDRQRSGGEDKRGQNQG